MFGSDCLKNELVLGGLVMGTGIFGKLAPVVSLLSLFVSGVFCTLSSCSPFLVGCESIPSGGTSEVRIGSPRSTLPSPLHFQHLTLALPSESIQPSLHPGHLSPGLSGVGEGVGTGFGVGLGTGLIGDGTGVVSLPD